MLIDSTNPNPLLVPPGIDMNDPATRAKMLGLPVPGVAPAKPPLTASPVVEKSTPTNVAPTPAAQQQATTGTGVVPSTTVTPPPTAPSGAEKQASDLQKDIAIEKFKQAHPWGSAPSAEIDPRTGLPFAGNRPGGLGKFLHGVGEVANIAGRIALPGVTAAIPGSQLGREAKIAQETKQELGAEKQASEENLQKAQAREAISKAEHPLAGQPGKTPAEITYADLMTGDNGKPRINPDTKKPYTNLEADAAVKQAEDTKVIAPGNAPATPESIQDYNGKVSALGLTGDAAKVYGTVPPGTTAAQLEKRYADAESLKKMGDAEAQTKVLDQQRKDAHHDAMANISAIRGLESVMYKDKSGNLVSGSYNDAVTAGAEKSARKVSPEDDKNNRMAYAQFGRWQDNLGKAASTMGAWDNDHDKDLAVHAISDIGAGIRNGIINIDTEQLQNRWLNNKDYLAMTPAGQEHMQNMFQLWSDAINLMKVETGGVPRGEHFLKLEEAIMPQPEKTQAQNRQALDAFSRRIIDDTKGHVRPNDMEPVIPFNAQGTIENRKTGQKGYRDADGKDVWY